MAKTDYCFEDLLRVVDSDEDMIEALLFASVPSYLYRRALDSKSVKYIHALTSFNPHQCFLDTCRPSVTYQQRIKLLYACWVATFTHPRLSESQKNQFYSSVCHLDFKWRDKIKDIAMIDRKD